MLGVKACHGPGRRDTHPNPPTQAHPRGYPIPRLLTAPSYLWRCVWSESWTRSDTMCLLTRIYSLVATQRRHRRHRRRNGDTGDAGDTVARGSVRGGPCVAILAHQLSKVLVRIHTSKSCLSAVTVLQSQVFHKIFTYSCWIMSLKTFGCLDLTKSE